MKDYRVWNYIHYIFIGLTGLSISIMANIDYVRDVSFGNRYGIKLTENNEVVYIIAMYVFSCLMLLYGIKRIYHVIRKKG